MKMEISKILINAYKDSNKNPNYALRFILNTLDPMICKKGILLPNIVEFQGESSPCEIDEQNAEITKQIFGKIDKALIERLLWIAYLMPEI